MNLSRLTLAAGGLAIILAGCGTAGVQPPAASTGVTPSPVVATPVATPSPTPRATRTPDVTPDATTERAAFETLTATLYRWNAAATPVMADMNDPALDMENFGRRTKDDRAEMRASLAAMKAAIPADIDPALGKVLRELVGSYDDKMTAIDDLAVAFKAQDYVAGEAAIAKWQRGIDRQKAVLPKILDAVRPFLSTDEWNEWNQSISGM